MKIACGHNETLSPTKGMYEEQLTADGGIGNHSLGMLSISSGCPKQSYYVIKLITGHEVGKETCWGNLGKQIEIEDGYDHTSFYVRMKFSQNM